MEASLEEGGGGRVVRDVDCRGFSWIGWLRRNHRLNSFYVYGERGGATVDGGGHWHLGGGVGKGCYMGRYLLMMTTWSVEYGHITVYAWKLTLDWRCTFCIYCYLRPTKIGICVLYASDAQCIL